MEKSVTIERKADYTADFIRSILDYDPGTGVFRWKHRPDHPQKWNTKFVGRIAGTRIKGHLAITVQFPGKYYAHRLAWLHYYGKWPQDEVDHINGVRDDNRIANLRAANRSENACNGKKRSCNTSGFVGVSWSAYHKSWEARIRKDTRYVWRKRFATAQEAHEARRAKLSEIHGEFARH